jgi:hypothetical protein
MPLTLWNLEQLAKYSSERMWSPGPIEPNSPALNRHVVSLPELAPIRSAGRPDYGKPNALLARLRSLSPSFFLKIWVSLAVYTSQHDGL